MDKSHFQHTRLLREVHVYKINKAKPGFRVLMRSEHDKTAWMKHILLKFTKPVNLVVDTCAGTFSVAKACMLSPKRRRFKGNEVNPSCMTKPILQLILLHARQMLSKNSDIDGKEGVPPSANVYVMVVEAIEMRIRLEEREVPEGLLHMHKFIPHILYHLSIFWRRKRASKGKEYSRQPV